MTASSKGCLENQLPDAVLSAYFCCNGVQHFARTLCFVLPAGEVYIGPYEPNNIFASEELPCYAVKAEQELNSGK